MMDLGWRVRTNQRSRAAARERRIDATLSRVRAIVLTGRLHREICMALTEAALSGKEIPMLGYWEQEAGLVERAEA